METASRHDVLKARLYPGTGEKSLFNSVASGTTISGWSPHNLRRVIIGEYHILIQWYITGTKTPNSVDIIKIPLDVNQRDLEAGTSVPSLLDLLFKKNYGRQFSNIEEVVFLEYEHEDFYFKDISKFSTYDLSTYTHLMYVSKIKGIDINAVYSLLKEASWGKTITGSIDRSSIQILYSPKDKTKTQIRNSMTYNRGYYDLDDKLQDAVNKCEAQFVAQSTQEKKDSVKLSYKKLSEVMPKTPVNTEDRRCVYTTSYNGMVMDILHLKGALEMSNFKISVTKPLLEASMYYRNKYKGIPDDLLPTEESIRAKSYRGFGRPIVADDDKNKEFDLLKNLKTLCEPLNISFANVTDDNLELCLTCVLNVMRSIYYANMLAYFADKFPPGYWVFQNLIYTVCDVNCIRQLHDKFESIKLFLLNCVRGTTSKDYCTVCAFGKQGVSIRIYEMFIALEKRLKTDGIDVDDMFTDDEDDEEVEEDEWVEDDTMSEDEDDTLSEDEDDTLSEDEDNFNEDSDEDLDEDSDEDSGNSSGFSGDSTYINFVTALNQKYTFINSAKFKNIVMERLSINDIASISEANQKEFYSVYITSFLYLVLYERINSVVRVARPMVQLMIETQVNSPISYDDREIEIINKYKNLGENCSSSNSFSFAHKISVEEQKVNRDTLIPLLKNIVERVVG